MHVKHFFVVLAVHSDNGLQWPKHVKANFILHLLHLMELSTY
jgi:hypothetical protein